MKNSRMWYSITAGLLFLLLFPGCLEHTITTTIRPDGTCERVIRVSGKDSISTFSFPFRHDGSWQAEHRREKGDSGKGGKFVLILRKQFPSMETLAAEYADADQKLVVRVEGERRFRWFYTYVRYHESYATILPSVRLPLAPFMTEEEVVRYQNGDTNDTLKKKAEGWYQRCIFEEVYRTLYAAIDTLRDPQLTRSLLDEKKEELYRCLMIDESKIQSTADAIAVLQTVLQTEAARKLEPAVDSAMQAFEQKDKKYSAAGDSYTNEVIMPGVVLETNAPELAGTAVVWRTDYERIRLRTFGMTVESRIVNVWAIVVTGAIVLFLVIMILWTGTKRLRRRNAFSVEAQQPD